MQHNLQIILWHQLSFGWCGTTVAILTTIRKKYISYTKWHDPDHVADAGGNASDRENDPESDRDLEIHENGIENDPDVDPGDPHDAVI